MTTDIINQLSAGAGINTRQVIDELVAAQRTAQTTPLNDRLAVLASRTDALGQLRSAMSAIASSLDARVRSGDFGLQPQSTNSAAIRVERIGAGPTTAFQSDVVVDQLAAGQRLVAAPVAALDTPVGEGSLNFVFGRRTELGGGDFSFAAGGASADFSVTIGPDNNSLAGLRDAINAASGGAVSASIVDSGNGLSLVLRGQEGAARAFVVSAAEAPQAPGLAGFAYTTGNSALGFSAAARDAVVVFDGVTVSRDSNRIEGLVPGVRLQLQQLTAGQPVTVGAVRDQSALSATLADFADTLGALRQLVADFRRGSSGEQAAGPLASDSTARAMDQALVAMINAPVAAAGGLRLRDLGVEVTRDGSVTFDAARFAQLPPEQLAQAETLLGSLSGSGRGLGLVSLQAIAGLATPATDGLDRQTRLVNDQLARAEERLTRYREQLTRQFAAMDVLVSSSKALENQLTQLVDSWYNRNQ